MRRRAYSIRTEQAYEGWATRFIAFCHNADPRACGGNEIVSFLQDLAVRRKVAASTQNQALNALVFLYEHVLSQPLGELTGFVRARHPKRLPVVLTRLEAGTLLNRLEGTHWLMVALLHGTGMRLMEGVRLRVKDIDFGYRQITVRDGKGQKDRVVPLALMLRAALTPKFRHPSPWSHPCMQGQCRNMRVPHANRGQVTGDRCAPPQAGGNTTASGRG